MAGFYEWQAPAAPRGPKRPVFVHRHDGSPIAVAGLWSAWRDPSVVDGAAWLHTCTLVTTTANRLMAPVHDRMPVLIERKDYDWWLDPSSNAVDLQSLLHPASPGTVQAWKVSRLVSQVRNDGPHLIAPLEAPTAEQIGLFD